MLCFFVSFLSSFFSLFVLSVNIIIGTQLQAASIDGLRPAWQPAVIYTLILYYLYISLANKNCCCCGE